MTPDERSIHEIQIRTNAPWWNGEAYAEYVGYPQRIKVYEDLLDNLSKDITAIMQSLRAVKDYTSSDKLRTLVQRIDNVVDKLE